MKKMFKKINTTSILCLFIVLCPILDIVSFVFRNKFSTNFSPSTFLRPLIPGIIFLYIFIKSKLKKPIIISSVVFLIYALFHLWIFNNNKTSLSYGTLTHEFQYLINYTYMILNLFIYTYTFKKDNSEKLKRSVYISVMIYIVSIFISILTNTSSTTYIEGMGFKGWFESGNSISAILVLSMFILLPMIKNDRYKKSLIVLFILIGVFLTFLIGTRVGLIGFSLSIVSFICCEILMKFIKKGEINKKILLIGISVLVLIALGVGIFGSGTIKRMMHLKQLEDNITDNQTGENSHVTGDILALKERIEKDEVPETELSLEVQDSIIDLYNYANENGVVNNDQRRQQLIYHSYLIKNQDIGMKTFFGNGYLTSFRELVFEMELVAILYNFGIIGFIIYIGPFIGILLYSLYFGFKNMKKITTEYIMLVLGLLVSFALSILSGYTFFNSSTMIIIAICALIINYINKLNVNNDNIVNDENSKNNKKKVKKKIVFGITSLTLGGAERVLVDICNRLVKNKNLDITILTIYNNGEYEKYLDKNIHLESIYNFEYKNMNNIKRKILPRIFYLNRFKNYEKFLENKFDLEIAFLEGPITTMFSCNNENVKKIAWIHNDIKLVFGTRTKS